MVSFFGLKFGGARVKKIDKNATPNGPPRPRLDLLEGEDQPYDGYNVPLASRPGTAHGMPPPRGPYANNTAATSMQNLTKHTKNNPSFASLRHANSDANLGNTSANARVTELAKPPVIGGNRRSRSSSLTGKGDSRGSIGPKPKASAGLSARRPSAPTLRLPPPRPPPTTSIPPAPTPPKPRSPLGQYSFSFNLPGNNESLPEKSESSETPDQTTSPEPAPRKRSLTLASSPESSPTEQPHSTAPQKDSLVSELSRPDSASTPPPTHGGAGLPPKSLSRKASVTTNSPRCSDASSYYSESSPTGMSTSTPRESSEESMHTMRMSHGHQYRLSLSTQNEDENEDRYRLSRSTKHDSETQPEIDMSIVPLPASEPLRPQTVDVHQASQQSPSLEDEPPHQQPNKNLEPPLRSPTKFVSPPLPSSPKFETPPPLPNSSHLGRSAPPTPSLATMEPRAAPAPPSSLPFQTDKGADASNDLRRSPTRESFWGPKKTQTKEEKKRRKDERRRTKEQKKAIKEGRSIISAPIPISVPEAAAAAPSLPSPALPPHHGSYQVHPSPRRESSVTHGAPPPVTRTMSPAAPRTMSPVAGRAGSPTTVGTVSPPIVRSLPMGTPVTSRANGSSTVPRAISPMTTGTSSPAPQSPPATARVSPTPSTGSPETHQGKVSSDRSPADAGPVDPNNLPLPPPASSPIRSPSLKQDGFQHSRPQEPEDKTELTSRNDDEPREKNNDEEVESMHQRSKYAPEPFSPALQAPGSDVSPPQRESLQGQAQDSNAGRRSSEALPPPPGRMNDVESEHQQLDEFRGMQGFEPANHQPFDDHMSTSPASRGFNPHRGVDEFGMNREGFGLEFDGRHPHEVPLPQSPTVFGPGPRYDEFSPRPSLEHDMEDYRGGRRDFSASQYRQDYDRDSYGRNRHSDYRDIGYRPSPPPLPPVPTPYVPPDRGYKAFVPGVAVPDDKDVSHLVTATKLRESRKFELPPKIDFSSPFPPPLRPRERTGSTSSFGASWGAVLDSPSQPGQYKSYAMGGGAARGSPTPLGKSDSRSHGSHEVRGSDFPDSVPPRLGQRDQARPWMQEDEVRTSDFRISDGQLQSPVMSPHAQDFPPSSFGRIKDQYSPGWDARAEDFSRAPPTGNSEFSGVSGRMDPGQTPTVRTFGAAVTEESLSSRDSIVPSVIDEGEDEYGDGDSYMGSSLHSSFIDSYLHSWNGDLDKEYRERYPEGIEGHLGIADGGNEPTPDQTPRPDEGRWMDGNESLTNLDNQDDDEPQFNMDTNWPLPAPLGPRDVEEHSPQHPKGLEAYDAGFQGEKTKKRPPPLKFEPGTTTGGKNRWNRLDDSGARPPAVGLGLESEQRRFF